MDRPARRGRHGSIAPAVSRLAVPRHIALRLVAAGAVLAAAGCASAPVGYLGAPAGGYDARWALDAPGPVDIVETGPAVMMPPLAAARRGTPQTQEPRGSGFLAAFMLVPFTGFNTKATEGALGAATSAKGYLAYGDLWEDGTGFSVSFIMRRPVAGSIGFGDTYALLCVDYVSFAGKIYGGVAVDSMDVFSVWIDAKTMLNRPLTTPAFWPPKPYVRYGVGLVNMPAVTATTAPPSNLYVQTLCLGLRAGVGIEMRKRRVGLFADLGPQIVSTPDQGSNVLPEIGRAEPMFCVPIRIGLTF